MIAEFSIVPVGVGESLSQHVARAFEVIEASDVAHEHHAMGTNLNRNCSVWSAPQCGSSRGGTQCILEVISGPFAGIARRPASH